MQGLDPASAALGFVFVFLAVFIPTGRALTANIPLLFALSLAAIVGAIVYIVLRPNGLLARGRQPVDDLAKQLQAQGKLAEAETLFRRALEGCERQLGAKHRDTLAAVNNLDKPC